ncbi:hypothetical protein Tco_0279086, partial [Tanacetum coccineum]
TCLQLLTASSAGVKISLDLLKTLEELILNSGLDMLQLNLPSVGHPSVGLSSAELSFCWTSFQLDFPSAGKFILSLIYVQI